MRAPRGTVLLLLGLLFAAGCSAGTPAGSPAPPDATTASSAPSPKPSPTDDRAAAFRKWGIPLLPPPPAPPAVKPIRTDDGKIPAVSEIQNHTLSHPNLHERSLTQQKHEICTQQTKLTHEYGTAPGLFRPPYGNFNTDTRAAMKSCGGMRAMVLWRESMQIKGVQFQRPDKKYHPGDIILAHFRGPAQLKGESMTKMVANLLRQVASQGFTLARLDDYV